MKISEQFENPNGGKIQIAEVSKGGNSSWGKKSGKSDNSIRLAWYDGAKFDPISSAELPLWGLKDLLREAVKRDMYNKSDLAEMIGQLTSSIYRQT